MYKATTVKSLGILPVNAGTRDALEVIGDYMRNTIASDSDYNETVRVMKSYIPNRFKLTYLKRNVN
jgi:hypothetical protein